MTSSIQLSILLKLVIVSQAQKLPARTQSATAQDVFPSETRVRRVGHGRGLSVGFGRQSGQASQPGGASLCLKLL